MKYTFTFNEDGSYYRACLNELQDPEMFAGIEMGRIEVLGSNDYDLQIIIIDYDNVITNLDINAHVCSMIFCNDNCFDWCANQCDLEVCR